MAQHEIDDIRTYIKNLENRIDFLETYLKLLMQSGEHKHEWEYIGDHNTWNLQKKCIVCDLHKKYVYPMRQYENHWIDITNNKKIIRKI